MSIITFTKTDGSHVSYELNMLTCQSSKVTVVSYDRSNECFSEHTFVMSDIVGFDIFER